MRPVAVEQQDETQAVVKSGVAPPERVVTTGFARLSRRQRGHGRIGQRRPPPAAPRGEARPRRASDRPAPATASADIRTQ